jgi:hypothetical protein
VSPDRRGTIGGPGHLLPRHRMRLRQRASAAAVLFLILVGSPAGAEPCALTDPECLTQTVDEAVDAVGGTVDSTEETIDQTVEETAQAVDETTTEVVGQVGKVVDELLGKDGGTDPGGGGKTKEGSGAGRPTGREGRAPDALLIGRSEPRDPSIDPLFLAQDSALEKEIAGPPEGDRAGGTVGAAARQLAFPALLAIVVLAFLVIQNRLDRRDPRLASAPLGPELMTFE